MTLDDAALFDEPAGPRPGAAPARKCLHPRKLRLRDEHLLQTCGRCGTEMDPARARRGRSARSRGTSDELTVARILGGRKIGPLGLPWDVVIDGYLRAQCKKLDRWPSVAQVVAWLDAIPVGPELRAVTLADAPGTGGGKTRRLIVLDLEEFSTWHGKGGTE